MDDRMCVLHKRKGHDHFLGGWLESIESINRQVHSFCYCRSDSGEQHKRYAPPCSVKCSCVQSMFFMNVYTCNFFCSLNLLLTQRVETMQGITMGVYCGFPGAGKRVLNPVFIQLDVDKAVEGMRTYFTQAPAFIFHLFLFFHLLSHL